MVRDGVVQFLKTKEAKSSLKSLSYGYLKNCNYEMDAQRINLLFNSKSPVFDKANDTNIIVIG